MENKLYKKNINLGHKGEKQVSEYLKNLNYEIIVFNFSHRRVFGEIDIIVKKNEILAFVEVKTRSKNYVNIADIITFKKKKSIIKTAEYFLFINKIHTSDYVIRFDVAYVNNFNIEYFENAFTKVS